MSSGYFGPSGGGGGGTDLAALPYNVVDLTDGSWTFLDPDALVDTNTATDGFNNVVMNELAAGSTDYAWGNATSANHRSPRWYIPLVATDADGNEVRITTDDTFILQARITKGTTSSEWSTEVVVGVAVDPSTTTTAGISGVGGMLEYIAGNNTAYGAWTVKSKSVLTSVNNVLGVSTYLAAGGRGQGVMYVNLNGSGLDVSGGSRPANLAYSSGVDLFLMVGVGTRGAATITAGDDTDFKIEYRIIGFDTA